MHTVRRLYQYSMSGITLGVTLVGLNLLLTVVLRELGLGSGIFVGDTQPGREQLSAAAAAIGVGLPVWFIHWLLVERSLDPRRPTAEAERGSAVRGLYFSVVLGVLLIFAAGAALTLLEYLIAGLIRGRSESFPAGDLAGSLSTLGVTGAAWLYHVLIRRRDMRKGPLTGAAAWMPRVYLYGAAGLGLILLLVALGSLVSFVIDQVAGDPLVPADFDEPFVAQRLGSMVAGVLVPALVWFGHWAYASRLTADEGWRGASERSARLRLAYFVGIIGASTIAVLVLGVAAGRAVLEPMLGATDSAGAPAGSAVRGLVAALLSALPWLVAWWLHLRWMRTEAAASGDPARPHLSDRLERHAVALVGLAFAAVGSGWLLGLLIDAALGGSRTAPGTWRLELANFLPAALLGFAVWAWKWTALQARHATDPPAEADSTVRRAFLLFTLAATVIASLGRLGVVLYRLFGSVLGVTLSGNPVSELSTPLGALLVAATVAAYHGILLRRDLALRAGTAESGTAVGEADIEPMTRRLVLTGPPGDAEAVVSSLRAQLPEGYRLDPE